MATKKKAVKRTSKKSKKATKPTSHKVADRKTQKVSITKAIYVLLAKFDPENVTVQMATELAIAVNSETKFNAWHLYFHRKNYRRLDLEGELNDVKVPKDNPVIRRLIGALKNKPASKGTRGTKTKSTSIVVKPAKSKTKSKKRVVRIKRTSGKKVKGGKGGK